MNSFSGKLQKYVTIIWYEVDVEEDSIGIFTRLNIGKISLTNAELVKALFLSKGKKDNRGFYTENPYGIDDKKQHEIALQWDAMEKGLHDSKFWAFITNEIHKKAFSRLVREIRRFFGFLRPVRLEADITFGCKDPAYTGYILAWLSMVYPMIGEYTDIHPDFENRIFRGRIYAEGKFRIIYAVIFAWNMLWDKNVRITFRHIRKFRL